ncbi:transposase [Bacillus cereus]|nr:transposase [Bacillus cereus]
MTSYDRREQLKAIHASRKAVTSQKVDEAIQRLLRTSQNINFNSVANEAGISKATLYNNRNFRERIESLRQQQAQTPTKKQIKREMSDSNKDVIIESLKRRIKKVEEENKQLRNQLKVAYADVYKRL